MLSVHFKYEGGLELSLGGDISTLPKKQKQRQRINIKAINFEHYTAQFKTKIND